MSTFTHLHVASFFSAHHGTSSPEELVAQAVAQDAHAAALTDRDVLSGAVRHVRACIQHGVDPIVGVELSLAASSRPSPEHSAPFGRGVLLAHGNTRGAGWAMLCRAVSAAHTPPRGRKPANWQPQLALDRLAALITGETGPVGALLLGPESAPAQALQRGEWKLAERMLRRLATTFPGALTLEVVCHLTTPGHATSLQQAARWLELAHHLELPAVLSNHVRYRVPDEAVTADVLAASGTLTPLRPDIGGLNAQAWLKSPQRMEALAQLLVDRAALPRDATSALLEGTERLAGRCVLSPRDDLAWQMPKTPEPEVIGIREEPNRALSNRCEAAFSARLGDLSGCARTRAQQRLRDELVTISGFGFATYFLAVADVTDLIRSRGIRVQARGSGAGSLVNYLLGISPVNPLEHDLLFERFLGRQRSTLPDIDLDVESARRHEIYRAIFRRYGDTRVSLLGMQSRYRARGATRDAGRALGISDEHIDLIAKQLWRLNARDLRSALQNNPELQRLSASLGGLPQAELLLDLAERLDRLPRHLSMHPCGVLLGDNTLLSVTPVQPSGIGLPMSQFDKDDIDDLGLLKLDVLGVRMQSSLAYTVHEITRLHGDEIASAGGLPEDAPYLASGTLALNDIPHDDEATLRMIRSTHTLGMFQIESPGQRELIGKMQPTAYEDLIADISLFRPGPMKGNMVAPYLDVRHGIRSAEYLRPEFIPFLRETHGVVVYHEQLIRILSFCMGIGYAEADELRRQMSHQLTEVERQFRAASAAQRDEDRRPRFQPAEIDRIWSVVAGFGSFGFCKAHGAAFALTTWQSAWLKTHFPAEFFAGLLTHDPGMYPKRLLVGDARRLGIPILPVDINRSAQTWTVERVRATPAGVPTRPGDLGIRVALADVQGITEAELTRILAERPFHSLGDVWERARPSRRLAERLAMVGAFDALEHTSVQADIPAFPSRGELIARVRELAAQRKRPRAPRADELQLPLDFDAVHAVELPQSGRARASSERTRERVQAELEVLSIDLSEHLIESYRPLLDELGVTPAAELLELRNRTEVMVAGVRVATQTPPMRSGKRVVFVSVDDGTGCADAAFFEEAQQHTGSALFNSKLLVIAGTTRRTGARGVSLQADRAWNLAELWQEWRRRHAA